MKAMAASSALPVAQSSSSASGPTDDGGGGSSVAGGEYRCVINGCGRTFQRSSNLDAHTRLHTQEAPFSCDLCNRNFLWKSSLLAHVRSLSHIEAAARAQGGTHPNGDPADAGAAAAASAGP